MAAKKVRRGTLNPSAHLPQTSVSSTSVSPTSKKMAVSGIESAYRSAWPVTP